MNTSDAKIIWMGGRTSGVGAQQHFDFFSFYHFFFFFLNFCSYSGCPQIVLLFRTYIFLSNSLCNILQYYIAIIIMIIS